MACPLCDHGETRPSWLGRVTYQGRSFDYLECLSCRSLYCQPMPDGQLLAKMYGPEYSTAFGPNPSVDDPKQPQEVIRWLKAAPPGTFLDYGCGDGSLLTEAKRLRWQPIGVEYDARVAREVGKKTGTRVVTCQQIESLDGCRADLLHLGDVIEHLSAVGSQLPKILKLVKPNGLLVAQGPLEANASLFTLVLRLARRLRKCPPRETAPYHVLLATAEGQRRLFARFGLKQLEYSVHEVAWPAPSRLRLADLFRPRSVGLFVLRHLSRWVSALRPGRWGNRYFYVGRWPG